MINLKTQYQRLKEVVLKVNRFVWDDSDGDDYYSGTISPVGIYIYINKHSHVLRFRFVLADQVSPKDLNGTWDKESPGGFITVALDNNLEFEGWDPASETLRVSGECSPDGTLQGYIDYLDRRPEALHSMALVFYEHQGDGCTCLLMQKR